jgi:quercetin dioxygenase-like cupin family protein
MNGEKKQENNFLKKEIILKSFIDYSKDAVVSKTIAEKKSGTVTLFAFDQGQNLSEHSAPFDAIVQIIEGEAEIIIGKESFILNEGKMIIMPANIPHAIKAGGRFKMLLTMIKQ